MPGKAKNWLDDATYSQIVRHAMVTSDNPTGKPITLRQLAKALDRSYEHCRKICKGEPVVSAELNDAICDTLGLDRVQMRQLAEKEKIMRRWKRIPADLRPSIAAAPTADTPSPWDRLPQEDLDVLRKVAEALDARRQQEATPEGVSAGGRYGLPVSVQQTDEGLVELEILPLSTVETQLLLAVFEGYKGDDPAAATLRTKLADAGLYDLGENSQG